MGGELSERRFLFTSESVTEGHPDRLPIRSLTPSGCLPGAGSLQPRRRRDADGHRPGGHCRRNYHQSLRDFQSLVRGVVASIGYDNAAYGFDSNTCAVISTINKQSGDIAQGVDTAVPATKA